MAENSKIEWTDHTFNPWIGCQAISPACTNCYAAAWAKRYGRDFAERKRTSAANWREPLKWEKQHAAFFAEHGRRQRVFCASLADVFDNQVPAEWRADLFELIEKTPHLNWLLLTKRIGNAAGMQPALWTRGYGIPPHVWLGATIANQEEADRDIPKLLATPAAVRFLSMEPLLGPVTLRREWLSPGPAVNLAQPWAPPDYSLVRVHWVITGGESGPGARPSHPDWFRSLRDQCQAAGVPYLHKQNGEWLHALQFTDDLLAKTPAFSNKWPNALWDEDAGCWEFGLSDEDCNGGGVWMCRVGKKAAGRLLDGRTWDGFPK